MMLNFCTLFDSNYMSRGLAMYESLLKHCPDFHLYIVTFDDIAYDVLTKMKLEKASIIPLHQFEDIHLLTIKPSRTFVEYMWTCTPSVILYCINQFGLDHCTYLDADLYFFSNPEILIKEAAGASILLTKHNYTPRYDKSKLSGIYCVQFMMFRNTADGMKALNWWRNACIDWCYNRYEKGKFGDQKYLDDWTERFEGVHVLEHFGGGIAPWNVQKFAFYPVNYFHDKTNINPNGIYFSYITYDEDVYTAHKFELIFYHFHYFRFLSNIKFDFGTYLIENKIAEHCYFPYIYHLFNIESSIHEIAPSILPHGKYTKIKWYKKITRYLRSGFKRNYNIHKLIVLGK
ncbi:MAG: glycosyl transferase [Bacteroidota bacterium]